MADQMRHAFELISSVVGYFFGSHKPEESRQIRGANPEWLAGTEAEKYIKGRTLREGGEKKQRRHKRPKAKERPYVTLKQPQDINRKVSFIKDNVKPLKSTEPIADLRQNKAEYKTPTKTKRHRRRSGFSRQNDKHEKEDPTISSELESDFDCQKVSTIFLDDFEETPDDDSITFYELSCRLYDGTDKELGSQTWDYRHAKNIQEGLKLYPGPLCRLIKGRKRQKAFYELPLTTTECEQILKEQPKKFKSCSIHIEGSHLAYCTPVKCDDKISLIEISGRSKAGRAFNEDEVVVEILNVDNENKNKRYGKVVGVLNRERHQGIDHPAFLCTLDSVESYHVRPICRTIPKIHILHNEIFKKYKDHWKNKVELYSYNHMNGTLKFKQIVDIKPSERNKFVFLVVYLQWERQQHSIYPIGAVIDILPFGNTIQHGLQILDLQYKVPSVYSASTVRRLKGITAEQQDEPRESAMYNRHDLTHLDTFTIDPTGSKDLDDALSIEKVEDGFRVGVHIADVTAFVKKGDVVDEEAKKRAVSFYSGIKRPRHMLPEPLSQNLCSLVPNKKRLCISVFHYLDLEGEHNKTEIKLSVIKSRRQFTYTEIQEIIENTSCEEGIPKCIRQLYRLAEKRRKRRLGYSMFALDLDANDCDESKAEDCIEAHFLVEEFMILTNCKIGTHLVKKYPGIIPLRCQAPPSTEDMDCLMREESAILNLVLKLQSRKSPPQPSLDIVLNEKSENIVMVHKWLWDLVFESPERASHFIKIDEHQPLQYLAYQHWLSIQKQAFYKSSSCPKDKSHYTLGFANYTHFTSPIRRYTDLIVHRLVHCMIENQKETYTSEEVENICHHINSVAKRAKAYERGCRALQLAIALSKKPKSVVCLIDKPSDKNVLLYAPDFRFVKTQWELPFNLLDMGFKLDEIVDPKTGNATIMGTWRKRIYDFNQRPVLPSGFSKDKLHLDQHPGMVFVPAWAWAKILKCAIECRQKDLQNTVKFTRLQNPERGLEDINTEADNIVNFQPSTTFSLSFTRGQSVKIQMSAEAQKGMLVPKPQLFNVTKSFKLCLQHMDDPVMHLTEYSTNQTLDEYSGLEQYLERWLPLVLMEAAVTSVSSEETCTINNVPVKFKGRLGAFLLPLSFCELRNIEFGGITDESEEVNETVEQSFDFMCLKYMIKREIVHTNRRARLSSNLFWIAHGEIIKVLRSKNDSAGQETVNVSFKLHSLSADPPMEESSANGTLVCSVEILIKSEVDRRTETFLKTLPNTGSSLAKRIALNNEGFQALDEDHVRLASGMQRDLCVLAADNVKHLPKNNGKQQNAIDRALFGRFTLIQGPPGTGKSYTGIKLMYLFATINGKWHKEGHRKNQVLFCGPSNKSVDLIAKWMLRSLGKRCPKIVRVYGRSIEAVEFPIPGKFFLSKRSTKNAKADEELHSVSLHHLIRRKGKLHADKINNYDQIFKKTNFEAAPEAVKDYLRIIREASIQEIRMYDVILCTTSVGSNPKIREGTKVFQLIVDEAGMCPEPQCLAPIIANKPEQVVLIGDHKQLRPIIRCKEAAELGLEKSLFERYYSNSSQGVEKTMLNIQYRMNPEICKFPSEMFYEGKLYTYDGLCCDDVLENIWPRKDDIWYPFVLIHVEGEEKILTVSTEDGNEQSKSNETEIKEVIRVFRELIDRQIDPGSMNIISQYNAQCSELRRRLEKDGFHNFKVNTVVSSQGGEWDYVIFSTVRSLPEYRIEKRPTLGWCKQNLGFITDQNQINVALTRARKGLIIIGNKNLLRCDEIWGKLVDYYEQRGCIMKQGEFPRKRTRQEKIWANIQRSEMLYGDEKYIKGELPDLGPYMPANDERKDRRSSGQRYRSVQQKIERR